MENDDVLASPLPGSSPEDGSARQSEVPSPGKGFIYDDGRIVYVGPRICERCEFWYYFFPLPEGPKKGPNFYLIQGQCRFKAPSLPTYWPMTLATDFCGEFRASEKPLVERTPSDEATARGEAKI